MNEVGVFLWDKVPLAHLSLLQIPIAVLPIFPHIHFQPNPPRMDQSPKTADENWHQEQAMLMCGLPPANHLQDVLAELSP